MHVPYKLQYSHTGI